MGNNIKGLEAEKVAISYRASKNDVSYAEFGADFYTYIYGATDTIVDELNAINGGMESISRSMNPIKTAIPD